MIEFDGHPFENELTICLDNRMPLAESSVCCVRRFQTARYNKPKENEVKEMELIVWAEKMTTWAIDVKTKRRRIDRLSSYLVVSKIDWLEPTRPRQQLGILGSH